jgi:hypothetical protein
VAESSRSPSRDTPAGALRQRHADGIYGTIITASVLASAGADLAALPLAVSVVITLGVYWIADVYARLLAGPIHHGRPPTWPDALAMLAATWPMVSASFTPVLVLAVARIAGASSSAAATAALAAAIFMLTIYAWSACRAAGLRGAQMIAVTSIAAGLGVLMIVLKNVVLVHLH